VLVVRLACGAERAHHAALDRRRVRRAQPDGGAKLIVRVGVLRVRAMRVARDRDRPFDGVANAATLSGGGCGSTAVLGLFARPR
jgi:hypothetical protein